MQKIKAQLTLAIILIMLCSVFSSAVFAKKVTLKLSFMKGETYTYKKSDKQSTETDMMGQKIKGTNSTSNTYQIEVLDVDAYGAAVLKLTFLSATMKVESMNNNMEYDSEKNESVPANATALDAVQGKSLTVKVSAIGEVMSVAEPTAIADAILEGKNYTDGAEEDQMRAQIMALIGKESMVTLFNNILIKLPTEKVKPKDTWSAETAEGSAAMQLILQTNYTFRGMSDYQAQIDLTSTISSDSSSANMEQNGMNISFTLNGKQTGNLNLATNGWVSSALKNQDLNGNMVLEGGSIPGGKMNMPMKMSGTITVTRLPN